MLAKKSKSECTFISPIIKVLGTTASLPRIYIEPDMASVSISALQVDEQVLLWRQSTVGPVRHIEGQLHTSQCRRSKVPLFPPVWPSRVHCALPVCALHPLCALAVALHPLCAPRVPPVASRHLRRRLFPVTWELLGRVSH